MMYRVTRANATINGIARVAIIMATFLYSLQLAAATPPPRHQTSQKKNPEDVVNDFAALAQVKPKKCIDDIPNESSAVGWHKEEAQCAWQNLLRVRRWEAGKDGDPKSCLSKQAMWWAWARSRGATAAAPLIWNSTWTTQSLVDDAGEIKRIIVIARAADGSWAATEWRWRPSLRAATRHWQAERWKLLSDAAILLRQSTPNTTVPQDAAVLKTAWEKGLKGAAGEVAAGSWLWERGGLCLRMETVGISQAQLHIPYSKDDGRLEQRAAMQIRLARTYPQATWLTPFRLLPLPDSAGRGGAKYEAIWLENAAVKGQLWMPSKADGAITRARIVVTLPTKHSGKADAAEIDAIARAVDRELIGLATIWTRDHEQ